MTKPNSIISIIADIPYVLKRTTTKNTHYITNDTRISYSFKRKTDGHKKTAKISTTRNKFSSMLTSLAIKILPVKISTLTLIMYVLYIWR